MLRHIQPHELAAPVLQSLAEGLENIIDEVILGNVVGPGGNVARVASLEAGLPLSVTGITIDRQCSAGLEAIRMACYFVQGRAGNCYLAGGVESSSTSPFPERARFSPDSIGDPDMGVAAELVAKEYGISRTKQDQFALLSYERSWASFQADLFNEEIVPISTQSVDEEFSKKRNYELLLKRAKPIFMKENGTVTAANSCGINDGASAVLVMEEKLAKMNGFNPVIRFVDSVVSGVHPNFPGISPVPAITELLSRNKLVMDDIDIIEINEAFASKIVACQEQLSIPSDKLNVCGGALTMGHPYGASGAILVTRLVHEVKRRKNAKYVIAAVGSGGGIGVAILFEVVM